MSSGELSQVTKSGKPYFLTLFLSLTFFALTVFCRNGLEEFGQPFTIVFLGMVILVTLSGRFEAFILILLIITSTVFELLEFPTVPIRVGDLYFSDLLIFVLVLGLLLKRVTISYTLLPKPWGYPALAVILVGIFSFLYATLGLGVSTVRAGIELRVIVHLSLVFLVFHYVKNERQLRSLLWGITLLGTAVAAMLIGQYIIGSETSIVSGRVETLSSFRQELSNVTRVLVPGASILMFTLITLIVIYLLKAVTGKAKLLVLPTIVLLFFGLLLTFTRIYWVMVLVAILLFMFLAHRRSIIYQRMAMLVIGASLGIVIILQVKVLDSSVISQAVFERSRSILSAPGRFKEDTLFIRYIESRYAWHQITKHPWLGIGLGNSYRPKIFKNNNLSNIQGISVHNGYLATQLKMGLPGTLAFFWLIIVFFKRALSYWYRIDNPLYQAIVLGITLSISSMFVHSLVASPFNMVFWMSTFAVGVGVVEKIYQFEKIA